MTSGRRVIDVHFHLIPQFFREAVCNAGTRLAVARYTDWSPQMALDVMNTQGIDLAIVSTAWPGAGFLPGAKAATFARRCNDYAAELIALHPSRFGCFGLVPMHDMDAAISEAQYCLEILRFDGIGLFASYGEKFLGDGAFDPLMRYLDSRGTVVHVHPSVHPSTKSIELKYPAWIMEYVFDTTRAGVNLIFRGATSRFPKIQFILSHAGGTLPYIALRLSFTPMLEPSLLRKSRKEILSDLKSFWYDTALSSGAQTMATLSRVAAKERILFGGDWPFCDEQVLAEEVVDLNAPEFLAPKEIEMITRDNALRLLPGRPS